MAPPLENLSGPGKALAAEPPDAKEFAGLKRSGLVPLKDAENPANSLESRFDLAYNAAHALSLAALRWHGYRPSKRYIVFQVMPHTLGVGPEVWRMLSKCHDVRNLDADVRQQLRQQRSKPISETLRQWLVRQRRQVPDGSATAKAIEYSLRRWAELIRHTEDGDLPIDNNHIENRIAT